MAPKNLLVMSAQCAHPQESYRTSRSAVYLRMTLNSVLQNVIQRSDMIIRCRICGGQLLRKCCTPAQLEHQTETTYAKGCQAHRSVPSHSPRSGVRERFRKNNTVLLRAVLYTGCRRLHFNTMATAWMRILQMSLQNLKPPIGGVIYSHFVLQLVGCKLFVCNSKNGERALARQPDQREDSAVRVRQVTL